MADAKVLSKKILTVLGGKNNVEFVTHCATRLRVTARDESAVNKAELKKINGVRGIVDHGKEIHIIIGTDVGSVYMEFIGLGDFTTGEAVVDTEAAKADTESGQKKNYVYIISDFIAACVLPSLPVIVAGGMMSAILVICTSFFGMSKESGTYIVFNAIYNAAFSFLPIFVGYNAAAKLKINPMLGGLLGAVLVCADVNGVANLQFMGIPIFAPGYSGSVIPVIFGVLFMQLIWKPLNKRIPEEIKFFVVPVITMAITVPVTLIALGPLGSWIGQGLGIAFAWLNEHLGWLSVGILGGTFVLMLFTGTAYGLYAIVVSGFAANNYEAFCQPAGLAANLAIAGASLAVMTMLKNRESKGVAMSTGLTALFGITEPAIFGVLGKYKRPFIGAVAGGLAGGVFAGITHVKEFAFVSPGVASIIAFVSPDGKMTNLIMAVVTMVIGFSVSFVVTRIIGLGDVADEEV